MRPKILIILSFLLCFKVSAQQKQGNFWFFGDGAGIMFNNKIPNSVSNGAIKNWNEGTSSIKLSDSSWFYSDGIYIYNRNNNRLNLPEFQSHTSSTQGSIMLFHPDNDSIIFFITNSAYGNSNCPSYYSELLIVNDTFLSIKRTFLLDNNGSEKISAVNHQNGKDIWIVTHAYFGKTYKCYLITKSGINICSVNSEIGTDYSSIKYSAAGQIKFSNDGRYVVSSSYFKGEVDIMKFDNLNGKLFDVITLSQHSFGCEFSSDRRFVYITDYVGNLKQYLLSNWNLSDISASEILLTDKGVKRISSLQIAPDNRIYWSNFDSIYIAAIEDVNFGDTSKLNFRSLYLNGKTSKSGLPTFNQSYFYTPSTDYKYELTCVSNTIQFWGKDTFEATTHSWQIKKSGKPAEATYTAKNISHTFTDTGKYDVRYIASNSNRQDTVIKTISIYPKINNKFLGKDTAYAQGEVFNRVLKTPPGMHCQLWQDSSGLSTFAADTAGVYYCKVINQSFCEVTDTIIISECINNLTVPSLFRSRDTLYTYQALADSFVWFRNNVQYRITKESFIKLTDTGLYRVEAAKEGHCNRSSSSFQVYKLGTGRLRATDLQIKLYPNPAQGKVFIETDRFYHLTVTDVNGRVMLDTDNPMQVHLPAGVYFFQFATDGSLATEMVLVY